MDDAIPHIAPVPADTRRPLWSVMIPTWNCARHLRRTLESVLAQAPDPATMQIEVVDDCSTADEPHAVVEEVGRGRVAFFRQPHNVGNTANYNTCLQRARGELVHVLHGDDCVRPGFYARMQDAFAREPAIGAAFCRYIAIDEDDHWLVLAPLEQPRAGVLPDWLCRIGAGQRLQTPCMVVRRHVYERIGGYDPRITYCEDWDMWVRIAQHYPVWYEPEPLALYRVHTSSLSGRMLRTGENVEQLRRVIALNRTRLPADRVEQVTRAALRGAAHAALRRSFRLLQAGEVEASAAQVRAAVRCSRSPLVLAGAAALVTWRAGRALAGAGRTVTRPAAARTVTRVNG